LRVQIPVYRFCLSNDIVGAIINRPRDLQRKSPLPSAMTGVAIRKYPVRKFLLFLKIIVDLRVFFGYNTLA